MTPLNLGRMSFSLSSPQSNLLKKGNSTELPFKNDVHVQNGNRLRLP